MPKINKRSKKNIKKILQVRQEIIKFLSCNDSFLEVLMKNFKSIVSLDIKHKEYDSLDQNFRSFELPKNCH